MTPLRGCGDESSKFLTVKDNNLSRDAPLLSGH